MVVLWKHWGQVLQCHNRPMPQEEQAALAESDEETKQAVAEAQAAVIELETRSLRTQKRLEGERQSLILQREARAKQEQAAAQKAAEEAQKAAEAELAARHVGLRFWLPQDIDLFELESFLDFPDQSEILAEQLKDASALVVVSPFFLWSPQEIALVEQFVGWRPDQLRQNRNP